MKTRTIIKAIALALAVSGCAIFTLQGLDTTASADDGVYTDTALIASATRSGYSSSGSALLDAGELFTSRDLEQSADLSEAQTLTVSDGQQITISSEGVYVLRGSAKNATVIVDADSSAKVQLVLDGLSITNDDFPCIYVKSADKVFLTTLSDSSLSVTGTFASDGDTNTDAVIFSKDDLTLNGTGTLTISSTENGVSCKDDLKITGGTYVIDAAADGIEASDSIRIADGTFTINSSKDALHAENDEDDTVGYIYLCGGTFDITAADDGIQATTVLQIDNGTFNINAVEALEATYVQVNGGAVNISASDDGINATTKSSSIGTPTIEVTGGDITIAMAQGDTDAIDANGNVIVTGGTINITGQSAFDFDGTATFTGGTITVNGEQISEITNSMMMGGGMMGGMGGQMEGGPMGGQGGGMGHMQGGPMGGGMGQMG